MADERSGYKHDASDKALDRSAEAAKEPDKTSGMKSSGPGHDPAEIKKHVDVGKDRLFAGRQQHSDLIPVGRFLSTPLVDTEMAGSLRIAYELSDKGTVVSEGAIRLPLREHHVGRQLHQQSGHLLRRADHHGSVLCLRAFRVSLVGSIIQNERTTSSSRSRAVAIASGTAPERYVAYAGAACA